MKQSARVAVLGALVVAAIVACNSSAAPDPNVPGLISPAENAVMDNGCVPGVDSVVWEFSWSPVATATSYELFVGHEGDPFPLIDDTTTTQTTYRYSNPNSYLTAVTAWHWWVRATVNGVKQQWAGPRDFTVEAANTDCP
jgi:hypothetical protein